MIVARSELAQIWRWLDDVPDPEIPALSIVDLGIVRDVGYIEGAGEGARLRIVITPTYSGCPAARVIEGDIVAALHARGVADVDLEIRLAPPWTTDWISNVGRDKLRAFGISPPQRAAGATLDLVRFVEPGVACPRCGTNDVEQVSRFGSTPCKALYRCNACREPFDHFKCH